MPPITHLLTIKSVKESEYLWEDDFFIASLHQNNRLDRRLGTINNKLTKVDS